MLDERLRTPGEGPAPEHPEVTHETPGLLARSHELEGDPLPMSGHGLDLSLEESRDELDLGNVLEKSSHQLSLNSDDTSSDDGLEASNYGVNFRTFGHAKIDLPGIYHS
jgi:hypothetical protein